MLWVSKICSWWNSSLWEILTSQILAAILLEKQHFLTSFACHTCIFRLGLILRVRIWLWHTAGLIGEKISVKSLFCHCSPLPCASVKKKKKHTSKFTDRTCATQILVAVWSPAGRHTLSGIFLSVLFEYWVSDFIQMLYFHVLIVKSVLIIWYQLPGRTDCSDIMMCRYSVLVRKQTYYIRKHSNSMFFIGACEHVGCKLRCVDVWYQWYMSFW